LAERKSRKNLSVMLTLLRSKAPPCRAVNASRFVVSSFRFVANETKQVKNFVAFH
jgi:hypothetical protein